MKTPLPFAPLRRPPGAATPLTSPAAAGGC